LGPESTVRVLPHPHRSFNISFFLHFQQLFLDFRAFFPPIGPSFFGSAQFEANQTRESTPHYRGAAHAKVPGRGTVRMPPSCLPEP